MEETNSAGLTFKQRVDAANATGWTNQPTPYNDSKIRNILETNAGAIACVCIVITIVLGILFVVKAINK